jgi:hypothetical protein
MFIKLNLGSFRHFTDRPGYSEEKKAFKNTVDVIVNFWYISFYFTNFIS